MAAREVQHLVRKTPESSNSIEYPKNIVVDISYQHDGLGPEVQIELLLKGRIASLYSLTGTALNGLNVKDLEV
jgi:hypothetical protein